MLKMKNIRKSVHDGTFYPANPHVLSEMLMSFYVEIDNYVDFEKYKKYFNKKFLISPHAGYIYSWIIATAWYKVLQMEENIDTFVVIWPAHYVGFEWWWLCNFDWFQTPLWILDIDKKLQEKIFEMYPEIFTFTDQAHIPEHSIEVQIPMIQTFLKVKKFIPILGWIDPDIDKMGEILANLVKKYPNLWVIISSDLSHYLPYEIAVKVDNVTIQNIISGNANIRPEQACWYAGINAFIQATNNLNRSRDMVMYANSGDTSWIKDSVVGYTSIIWFESKEV